MILIKWIRDIPNQTISLCSPFILLSPHIFFFISPFGVRVETFFLFKKRCITKYCKFISLKYDINDIEENVE